MHLADYWPSTCKGCVDGPQKGVIRGVKWWWLLVRTVGDGRHLCTCVHFRFECDSTHLDISEPCGVGPLLGEAGSRNVVLRLLVISTETTVVVLA